MEPETYNVAENEFVGFDQTKRIPSTTDVGALNLWTSKATSCLIAQYKRYRVHVGQSTKIRSLREMFEMISFEMQKYGFYFSAQKCENKWRVLERKYKNLVFRERLKKPGRMRHYGHWEHRRALDEIFNEKKRHMYLDENDFPPPSASAKLALMSEKTIESGTNNFPGQSANINNVSSISTSTSSNTRIDELPDQIEVMKLMLGQFIEEMTKNFDFVERSNERRHKEKMAMKQNELEVQKRLLRLKEQKLELKKSQILAAAQQLSLNM